MLRKTCIRSVCLLLLGVGSANAQNPLSEVVTVDVRPGMNTQFEEFSRALVEAARQQDAENYWRASQSVSGTPRYTFNIALSGWVDMANPGPQLEATFGAEEAARLGELAAHSIEGVSTAFYRPRLDLSYPPPEGSETPAALTFSDLTVNAGMMQQYIEVAEKTNEASQAVLPDAHYIVFLPDIGADSVRVIGLVPSWSDLDEPFIDPGQRVLQHFGQDEGGRIVAQAGQVIGGIEVSLQRTRPDLSYQPAD